MDLFCYVCLSCLTVMSVTCSLVVTCRERADLLAFLLVFFITFPYGVIGQQWYLIVSIPDLCLLSYSFMNKK